MSCSLSAHLRLCFSFMWAVLPVVYTLLFSYSFSVVHPVQEKAAGELMMEAGDKENERNDSDGEFFSEDFRRLHFFLRRLEKKEGSFAQDGIVAQHAELTKQRWIAVLMLIHFKAPVNSLLNLLSIIISMKCYTCSV